ncbi:MAG: hypothetical protein IPM30_09230 [Burkholderiales bacterium]|jgi:hypothetical protein|nr:hypothetical protein [Burkholderiales bacterium]
MKATIAAIALSAAAVAAPLGAAQAHTAITVGIDTPTFGLRIGAPFVPVFAPVAPVYVPAPVFVSPPVVYVPPRVVVRPVFVHPVVHRHVPRPGKHHRGRQRDGHRDFVPVGYRYGGR